MSSTVEVTVRIEVVNEDNIGPATAEIVADMFHKVNREAFNKLGDLLIERDYSYRVIPR